MESTLYPLIGIVFLQDFFKALNRVKNIHEDVKVLLRTNQQTAGWAGNGEKNRFHFEMTSFFCCLKTHCSSWFVLMQTGDHGTNGGVTGDIIWAAVPLGSKWVCSHSRTCTCTCTLKHDTRKVTHFCNRDTDVVRECKKKKKKWVMDKYWAIIYCSYWSAY